MEDINNFKILIQKMKTHSLLFHFLMKSTTAANYLSNQQKDCYQIPPVILKLFGWTALVLFDESGFLSRYNTQQVVATARVSQSRQNRIFFQFRQTFECFSGFVWSCRRELTTRILIILRKR